MNKIINSDCIEGMKALPAESVDCCVTSPPYFGLRSYLPDMVKLKDDAPEWVVKKLFELGVNPLDFSK